MCGRIKQKNNKRRYYEEEKGQFQSYILVGNDTEEMPKFSDILGGSQQQHGHASLETIAGVSSCRKAGS